MEHLTNTPQRRWQRVPRPRPVLVSLPGGHDAECSYLRLDLVARGGAQLCCDSPLPAGEQIALEICLAGGVIRTRARVVGCHRGDDGAWRVGVEFLTLSPEDEALLLGLLADED